MPKMKLELVLYTLLLLQRKGTCNWRWRSSLDYPCATV